MITQEIIEVLKGEYTFKSPYHKNKRLPFNIIGYSLNEERPVEVETVEYKGWTRSVICSNYTLKTILEFIVSGKMKRVI